MLTTPRQGAEVVTVELGELEEIYALRAMVESHAAARAATRMDDSRLEMLRELRQQMEMAQAQGRDAMDACFPSANAKFHSLILEAAESPRLTKMAALVVQLPLTLRALAGFSEDDRQRSLLHHSELISAFEARSPEWAASVMRSHIYAALFVLSRNSAESWRQASARGVAPSGGKTPARPSVAGSGAPPKRSPSQSAAAIRRSRL